MHFAVALPWWGYVLAFSSALALAWLAYARVVVALTSAQRTALTVLRGLALLLIVAALLRPVAVVPAVLARDSVLPVLVDVSRSMRIPDVDGASRIARAQALVTSLTGQFAATYRVDVLTFGESLARAEPTALAATARRSDLAGALAATAERYRGQQLAGVVVLSDGGDTGGHEDDNGQRPAAPVFAVGIGSAAAPRDREIVNLTAGEPLLPGASVDLSVSAVSSGLGNAPIELRVSANGRPIEVRRVTPSADGAPVHEVFTVSPSADSATVYTVDMPTLPDELVAENNARSVLVPPQGARRTVLIVEGAPGFDHTFLKRALARDAGLDVDSVVRKGQNDQGRDTFFVQAGESRAEALASGYPSRKADLFRYDAIVFGNVEAEFFTRDQLELTAQFVAARGGGLLVLGARSFERQGLTGTPLDEVLPVDLTTRMESVARVAQQAGVVANAPSLTTAGVTHAATRLAVSAEENRKRWHSLPPLAAVTLVGGPRAGAQVLAVSAVAGGAERALIAAQRYGQGRTMVFAGEASWRWRMMLPATDTTYETIWRQMTRWIAAGATGPVTIPPTAVTLPGTDATIAVVVKDEEFAPVANADVTLTLTGPDGQSRRLAPALADPQDGRYAVGTRFEQPGVYRVDAEARRGSTRLGIASRQLLVGGTDLEMAEPRLNEEVLKRMASASGGRYFADGDTGDLAGALRGSQRAAGPPELKDLWHNAWTLLAVIGLLATEWLLRRRVGLA